MSMPCRNQGYVLDGFPETYEQATELFKGMYYLAWFGFVAAFVFIAADVVIIIIVLSAILLEGISTVMTAVKNTKQSFVMCDY